MAEPIAPPDRTRRNRLVWVVVAVLAIIAVVAVAFASRFGVDPGLTTSPLIGRPAPDQSLPRLNGEGEVDLSSFRGDVLVLNFFASWCLECIDEHSALVETAAAYQDRGVRFVGVAFQDRPQAANAFLDDLGRSQITEYLDDPGSLAAISYGVFGVPETFFVDSDGTIVAKIVGASDSLLLASTLDGILAGDQPGEQVVGDTQSSPGG